MLTTRTLRRLCLVLALTAGVTFAQKKLRELKPGFNLFSVDQDIQMGREYAQQIEKEVQVVNDPALVRFVEDIGKRLSATREAQGFPLTFKVVNERSINAFALPGGPTYTHTGLILAADNDGQVAGVLAHEISHVILRHGTNQASKAQLISLPAMLGAEMLGARGGITGMLAQLGIGLGANSVLLKFSRSAERDADLLGTRIMSAAGYNPIEMARFFEKLEAESGRSSRLGEFLASHPNPGNRVKAVQDEIQLLPRRDYQYGNSDISSVKQVAQRLPEPPKKPAQQQQSAGNAPQGSGNPNDYTAARPSNRLKQFQGGEVVFGYPENWEVFPNEQTRQVTIAPRSGMVGQAIGYGMIANIVQSSAGLDRDTQALIQQFQQGDPNLRVSGQPRRFRLSNSEALATRLQGPSPFRGVNEELVLITAQRPRGTFFLLLIAPDRDMNVAQPVFDQIIQSVRFAN